ncbi:MAG: molecular chaperone TorD family protein [Planctomycetes bacterium]|nr:molecular chaperone TorD family protein [Planctomycetota bacterium]
MSDLPNIQTAFDRAKRYQELSRAFLRATESDPTLSPECPPYETQYGAPHVFAQSAELADVAAFYHACGLAAPEKERVDHVAVELEFMAFLAIKEAYATYSNERDRAAEMRELQRKFLTDHLARWAPSFAARFEAREPELARGLGEWLAADLKTLGTEPALVRAMDLRPPGAVEETFRCGGEPCDLA